MYIHKSNWHTFNSGALSSLTVSRWRGWHSGRKWSQFSSSCTCSFAPQACLSIPCCAILTRKAAVRLIFMNHCRLSFYCSLHLKCQGNSSPRFFCSRTSAQGFGITRCISSIAAPKNTSLAILATLKARCMSDCSNDTQPPHLAIVADRLKTRKKSVATSKREIRPLPLPHTTM